MSDLHAQPEPEIPELPRPDEAPRDAIGEDDNPIPAWFNVSFYGMIVVGIVYLLYHLLSGWSQVDRYEREVATFEAQHALPRAQREAARAAAVNPFHGDPQAIAAGREVFTTVCAACHKPDGTGLIGPSLVDPYWKYGSDDATLFESVAKGRPGGMPPWEAQLGADKIWQALAYLETLPRQSEPGVGAPAPGAGP